MITLVISIKPQVETEEDLGNEIMESESKERASVDKDVESAEEGAQLRSHLLKVSLLLLLLFKKQQLAMNSFPGSH